MKTYPNEKISPKLAWELYEARKSGQAIQARNEAVPSYCFPYKGSAFSRTNKAHTWQDIDIINLDNWENFRYYRIRPDFVSGFIWKFEKGLAGKDEHLTTKYYETQEEVYQDIGAWKVRIVIKETEVKMQPLSKRLPTPKLASIAMGEHKSIIGLNWEVYKSYKEGKKIQYKLLSSKSLSAFEIKNKNGKQQLEWHDVTEKELTNNYFSVSGLRGLFRILNP